jgi:hypothetical protein
LLIDNVLVDQYTLTSYSPFVLITTDSFSVTTAPHTLTLEGSTDNDHTAFVSNVSLTGSPTPEPATFVQRPVNPLVSNWRRLRRLRFFGFAQRPEL